PVGIILQLLTDGVIGGEGLRGRSERGFVRRELEHAGDPGGRALAPPGGGASRARGDAVADVAGRTFHTPGLTARWGPAARLRRRPYSGLRGFRRGPWRARRRRP